jgi:elongation factor 1-gamma
MKLYGFPASSRVTAAAVALDACGVQYETQWISFEESKSEKILKLNPQGKIPILETPEGSIYETVAIIRHAARLGKKLGGETDHEQALVDQWLSWLNSEVASTLGHFFYQTLGFDMPHLSFKHDDIAKGKESFLKQLDLLNKHLEGKKAVVGDNYTVADYTIAVICYQPLAFCFGSQERTKLGNVVKLIEGIAQTPAFQKWYGNKLRWVDHALQVAQPAKKEKEQPKKKEAAPAKPKEEKKKAPKEDDEDIENPPKKPEPKFPDTQLNLMTFKTFFINEKDTNVAMESFWNDFKEGEWSLWHLKYIKYPGECEVVYRTNNLLRTFMSRLDDVRKYIFGTHMVLGDEPNLEIEGVWLMRGPTILEAITEIDVYDTYKWDKLDSTKPEHRALVTDFWTHRKEEDEQVQGKTIRTFKWIK